jgi:hypothetical protein
MQQGLEDAKAAAPPMKPGKGLAVNVQKICWKAKGYAGAQGQGVNDCQRPGLSLCFCPGMRSEAEAKDVSRDQQRYCQHL